MKLLPLTSMILAIASITTISCNEDKTMSGAEKVNPVYDLADAKRAIDSLNVVFSSYIDKADSAGLVSMFTSDAKIMMPNRTAVNGRAEIQSAFHEMFGSTAPFGITATVLNVWGTEAMVAEEGSYIMTDKDGRQIDKGKYLTLWKREDGQWKIFRDISNSDYPPPAK